MILFTLILPGLTLAKLISWLDIPPIPFSDVSFTTRRNLAKVANEEINRLHSSQSVSNEDRSFLNNYFDNRFRLLEIASLENDQHKRIESARKTVLHIMRKTLLQTWEHGHIDDKVLTQIERELDAEEIQTPHAEI